MMGVMNKRLRWLGVPAAASQGALLLVASLMLAGCGREVTGAAYKPAVAKLNSQAHAAMQQGNLPEAIRLLESAHELLPEEPKTTYNLAMVYQRAGETRKAIEMLELLLHREPTSQAWQSLGVMYEAQAEELMGLSHEAEAESEAEASIARAEAGRAYLKAAGAYGSAAALSKNPELTESLQARRAELEQMAAKLSSGADAPEDELL